MDKNKMGRFTMTSVFDPFRMSAVVWDVRACDRARPQDVGARQKTRLVELLNAAKRGSRLYRERLQGLSTDNVPLDALPIVCKSELMARFDDWVCDPLLTLPQLRALMANPLRIGEAYLGKYLVWESSGTSHESGIFVQDAQSLAVYDALESVRRSAPRPLQRWLDPFLLAERIAFVGATTGHFASIVTMLRLQQINPLMAQRLRCFSILQSTQKLVEDLNDFAPTVIATYPTVAALLAEEFSRGTLRFAPKEIWTGGETLGCASRKRMEKTLGCAVRNSYGASEFMSMGWECSAGQMHANTDWAIFEPVDEKGQPVPEGQPSYTTLLTNLANHVQPLIRYDLGDQLTVFSRRCDCGSPLPLIEVQGRRDDVLVMAGQHGQPVTLLPLALTTVLEDDAGAFEFQLVQRDAQTLVIRLDQRDPEAASKLLLCCAALEKYAVAQGLAAIQVVSELGAVLQRGRSGKVQRVIAAPHLRQPQVCH